MIKILGGFGFTIVVGLALFGSILSYRAVLPVLRGESGVSAAECADICVSKLGDIIAEDVCRRK